MGSERIGHSGGHTVDRIEPGIYFVRLAGHLSVANSTELTRLIRIDDPSGPRAVLYETSREFTGYDSELRNGNQNVLLDGTSHIGIITGSALLRMVSATIAIGLRAALGIPMATYPNLEAALTGAREVLSKARHTAAR
jgi:hypothetical protein